MAHSKLGHVKERPEANIAHECGITKKIIKLLIDN